MRFRVLLVVTVLVCVGVFLSWGGQSLWAFPFGVTGHSGNPATGGRDCTVCHSGGIAPDVGLIGRGVAQPGELLTYRFKISGGQEVAGGFNVSVSDGALSVISGTMDVRKDAGELTHTSPPKLADSNGDVTFAFEWTAPITPTTVMLYAAGNSVNKADGPDGDGVSTAVYTITVGTFNNQLFFPIVSND